jgi:hypothetical protein
MPDTLLVPINAHHPAFPFHILALVPPLIVYACSFDTHSFPTVLNELRPVEGLINLVVFMALLGVNIEHQVVADGEGCEHGQALDQGATLNEDAEVSNL